MHVQNAADILRKKEDIGQKPSRIGDLWDRPLSPAHGANHGACVQQHGLFSDVSGPASRRLRCIRTLFGTDHSSEFLSAVTVFLTKTAE